MAEPEATPRIAVVIPTHERSVLLRRTLAAIEKLDYPAAEVVVVDDGSSPEERTASRRWTEAAGATFLEQENAGPATARNRGVAATRSEFVAFLDDDCAPTREWLRRLVAPFAAAGADDLAAVSGAVESQPPHNWMSRFCAAAEYISGVQPEFTNAVSANACYRRAVLEELHGFDEGFRYPGGEDPDLSRRVRQAGYRLTPVADAIVLHAEIDSLAEFLRRWWRRGLGEARMKSNEGRRAHVFARAASVPLYCARRAAQTWRVTTGKAPIGQRVAYSGVEVLGAVSFVAGSVAGLIVER